MRVRPGADESIAGIAGKAPSHVREGVGTEAEPARFRHRRQPGLGRHQPVMIRHQLAAESLPSIGHPVGTPRPDHRAHQQGQQQSQHAPVPQSHPGKASAPGLTHHRKEQDKNHHAGEEGAGARNIHEGRGQRNRGRKPGHQPEPGRGLVHQRGEEQPGPQRPDEIDVSPGVGVVEEGAEGRAPGAVGLPSPLLDLFPQAGRHPEQRRPNQGKPEPPATVVMTGLVGGEGDDTQQQQKVRQLAHRVRAIHTARQGLNQGMYPQRNRGAIEGHPKGLQSERSRSGSQHPRDARHPAVLHAVHGPSDERQGDPNTGELKGHTSAFSPRPRRADQREEEQQTW